MTTHNLDDLKKIETPYGCYYEYRGLTIEQGFYGDDEYTVSYCGDDILCDSLEDAIKTVDELIDYEEDPRGDRYNYDVVESLDPDGIEYSAYLS